MNWPPIGPERDIPTLRGHANTLLDLVGPIDGSARLTLFTEGNHFPALFPLLYDTFPGWCAQRGGPAMTPGDILAVTLPQGMILDALLRKGLRLGNAVIPIGPDKAIYPDIVMAGTGAFATLAAAGIVDGDVRVFARHKGMGLMLRRGAGLGGLSLSQIAERNPRVVLATPSEHGAREQYRQTLEAILGPVRTEAFLAGEVTDFPGRLSIQHRDVPYSLIHHMADVGLIFGHLARYYADAFPESLAWTELPGAEPFGREIAMAATCRPASAERDAFMAFFPAAAGRHYPLKGFAVPDPHAQGAGELMGEETARND
ncbi:MAG: hypothetical protein PVH30_02040 [Desulfobacterales bacterium]